MIVYANGRVTGTTHEGDPSFIRSVGTDSDALLVSDEHSLQFFYAMLVELKKMNLHLESMTDQKINDIDIENSIDVEY